MQETVKLLKDCPAILIPSGIDVTLAAGNEVTITHRLGGKFTVRGIFGIARIENEHADILGVPPLVDQPLKSQDAPTDFAGSTAQTQEHETAPEDRKNSCALAHDNQEIPAAKVDDLWEVAKTVFDPEIPVNIVDLGLIYRMEILKTPEGKTRAEADMTLTAPGCSMGPVIAGDLKMRLEALPSIDEAQINIVLDPPWNTDMMTQEARMILGLE